jgi:hypothetical protein
VFKANNYAAGLNALMAHATTRFVVILNPGQTLTVSTHLRKFTEILNSASELGVISGCTPQGKAVRLRLENYTYKVRVDTDFTCEPYALGGIGSFLRYDNGEMVEDCYSTNVLGSFFVVDTEKLKQKGLDWDPSLPSMEVQHYDFFLRAKLEKLGVALCNAPEFNILDEGVHVITNTNTNFTASSIKEMRIQTWEPFIRKYMINRSLSQLFIYFIFSFCLSIKEIRIQT